MLVGKNVPAKSAILPKYQQLEKFPFSISWRNIRSTYLPTYGPLLVSMPEIFYILWEKCVYARKSTIVPIWQNKNSSFFNVLLSHDLVVCILNFSFLLLHIVEKKEFFWKEKEQKIFLYSYVLEFLMFSQLNQFWPSHEFFSLVTLIKRVGWCSLCPCVGTLFSPTLIRESLFSLHVYDHGRVILRWAENCDSICISRLPILISP